MEQYKIDRINELARKHKTVGLTPEEAEERAVLRREYIDSMVGSLKGHLFKDAKKNRVFVSDKPQPGSKSCQTNYKVLDSRNGLSLVECELITGRTHQIRAQFAHAGHPLLGDGKYGKLDKRFDRTYQALYSYKLTFTFETEAGSLENLNGKSFQVSGVDFVKEYFPEASRRIFGE